MAKNNAVLVAMRKYQELVSELTPKLFSSFAIALHELEYDKEQIYDVLSLTQEIWEQSVDKGIDLVKWCNDEVQIEMSSRVVSDKAKPGGGSNNG